MKTLTASALVLALLALSASGADAHSRKKKVYYGHQHYAGKHVKPQVRGWLSRGGGYAYGYELDPALRKSGPAGNYPYFDDRNFWERVQSDPHGTRPGVSSF
jgi:hypothetical protein